MEIEIKKIEALPSPTSNRRDVVMAIKKFQRSKMKYAHVDGEFNDEELKRTYNSFYQACRRMTGVKTTRVNNQIYLVKVDKDGNEE